MLHLVRRIEPFWAYLTLYLPHFEVAPYVGTYVIFKDKLDEIFMEYYGVRYKQAPPRFYIELLKFLRESGIQYELRRSSIKIHDYPLEPLPFLARVNTYALVDIPGRIVQTLHLGKVLIHGSDALSYRDIKITGTVVKLVTTKKVRVPYSFRNTRLIVTQITQEHAKKPPGPN